MTTITVKFDLYAIYERVLEGCIVNINIEYDIKNILLTKELSKNTVKIKSMDIDKESLAYIDNYPFNKTKIYDAVRQHFKDEDSLLEVWGEDIPNEEYSKIEHLI